MQYNSKQYPHPVLGIEDDVNGTIDVNLNVSSDGKYLDVSPSYRLINNELLKLLNEGKAFFVSHIYCRGTMYREAFKTEEVLPKSIRIEANKLNGEVEVDFLICANESFIYRSKEFHPDYSSTKFQVEKGDLLAYAGRAKFYADLSPEELKSVSALMRIDSSGKSKVPMELDYAGDRITILLSIEDYEAYQIMCLRVESIDVIHSSIVLPCLIESLHYLDNEEASEFLEKRWYKTLKELLDKNKSPNKLVIAQNILDKPLNRTMKAVIELFEN